MQFRFPAYRPPGAALAAGAVVAAIQAGSRVLYPLAALRLIHDHASAAMWLLGLVVVASIVRAIAVNVGLESVRADLYARVATAIVSFPAVAPPAAPSVDQIEA